MAGKEGFNEGAAGERLQAVVEALGAVVLREALALRDLAPSADAPAIEKTAKAAKALADAGRSLVAFAKAAAPGAEPPEDEGPEMDDPTPRPDLRPDAEDLERRRERLVQRFAVRSPDAARPPEGAGRGDVGGDGAPLAGALARRAAPA